MPELRLQGPTPRCICRPGTPPTYRDYHEHDCPLATAYDKAMWARDMVADPARASVEMSGMSAEDLRRLREAFE